MVMKDRWFLGVDRVGLCLDCSLGKNLKTHL